jgi:PPIC-type PPIASE domain.
VAKTGGDIGEVGHDLPADIDKVIFSIPLNQFSEPVRSQYGYHVFQVMSRSTKPFSEVKPIMERSEDRLRAREVIEDLRKKAKVDFAPGFGPASRAPGAQ